MQNDVVSSIEQFNKTAMDHVKKVGEIKSLRGVTGSEVSDPRSAVSRYAKPCSRSTRHRWRRGRPCSISQSSTSKR